MSWSDDDARTGRVQMQIPANAGLSFALKVGSATLPPFAMGTHCAAPGAAFGRVMAGSPRGSAFSCEHRAYF